jgi:hypothetical protein
MKYMGFGKPNALCLLVSSAFAATLERSALVMVFEVALPADLTALASDGCHVAKTRSDFAI